MFGSRCIVSPTVISIVTSDHSDSHTHSGLLLRRHTHHGTDINGSLRRIPGARSLSVSLPAHSQLFSAKSSSD
ncbi:hypothetical protein QQF64_026808 [Cirrhinus molitorella]|uniref:Uncharacterized protein n=1 Tax=Cirrhinus molitorella TaxID=172907 RepID=A0ABR3NAM2_9TELE